MTIDVVGYIYSGHKSSYTYSTNDDAIPTQEQVSRIAGDFSQVVDYRLIRRSETTKQDSPNKLVRTITQETVKPFTAKGAAWWRSLARAA